MSDYQLMLDFETLDTKSTTAVVSLGVVLFNRQQILDTRYFKFNVQKQLNEGRTVSIDTVNWWMTLPEETRKVLKPDLTDISLFEFGLNLQQSLARHRIDTSKLQVWGNGADFDVAIAKNIFDSIGVSAPWQFNNVMCFRTVNKQHKIKDLVKRVGTHHHALDDAKYQTECLIAHWNK